MRVLFCGSGEFAVPSLLSICDSKYELVGVITQPARPAGRGGKLRPTPVLEAATAAGLDVTECPDINADETVENIKGLRPDVICVADFGQMVRRQVRSAATLDAFNLHASLLPALRGAAPVNWAIIHGHKQTGVTTFSLVDRMDAGAIYLQMATDIKPSETALELRGRLAEIGSEAACRTLDLLASGNADPLRQNDNLATEAPKLTKTDGLIGWDADAETILNLIHGTWPWPGGQAMFRRSSGQDLPVTIARAAVATGEALGQPGRLDADLFVTTGSGRLEILEIKPAGKRLMSWRDFVNGYRAGEDDSFISRDR